MCMLVLFFSIHMPANLIKPTVAAINKLEREGVAPNGATIMTRTKNTFFVRFQGKQKGPNNKSAIYLGNKENPRYLDWSARIDRRRKVKQLKRDLKALQAAECVRARSTATKEKPSQEWYTPPEFIEMARKVLVRIDLDPASNPTAQQWVEAGKYYTKQDNGLTSSWFGNVWCNPPYGKYTKLFMERALTFYQNGEIEQCVFLVNRTGAAWYLDLLDEYSAVCQVRKRISFLKPDGKPQGSPRYYNDFVYIGPNANKFCTVFSQVGRCSQ